MWAAILILVSGLFGGLRAYADNEDYGVKAYQYVRYMNDNLPKRINNNEITTDKTRLQETRQWIVGEMAGFGYGNPEYWYGENLGNEYASVTFHKAGKSDKTLVIGAHYDCVDTHGAEDNATGVGLLLELADRFKDTETNLSIDFCFWDGEEFLGMAGSFRYLELLDQNDPVRYSNIFCYINLDSIGAGDNMYAYGGIYGDDGVLYQSWGYNMAMTLAMELGVDLHEIPSGIENYTPPTRKLASDQYYFWYRSFPYVYFEANAWVTPEGSIGYPEKPYDYNSVLECFADTNGQIIHTKYDDLDLLESLVPGRIRQHLTDFSRVVSEMVREMDESSPEEYAHYVSEAAAHPVTEEETTEEVTETETETTTEEATTEESTTEESSDTSEEETETKAPETSEKTSEETAASDTQSQKETEESKAPEKSEKDEKRTMWLYIGGCGAAAVLLIALSIVFSRRGR